MTDLGYVRGPAPLEPAPARSCGDCRLCCKVLGIQELEKEPWSWCRFACSKGCAIYDSRPFECRSYVCSWLAGSFRDEDRPDRARVVVHVLDPPRWARDGSTGETHELVEMYASDAGVERAKRGAAVLNQILNAGSAAAVHHGIGRVTLYFPSGHVSEMPRELYEQDFASWKDPES
jgi:hypothetical protein